MTRPKSSKLINEATELGRKNAQKHLYLNWCKYLQINLVYPSELGQMTGLPIGPHQIQCPYFHGTQGVSVELIANGFIQEHCTDCKYHEEVDPDNIGRGLVETARLRKNQPDPHVLLRQQLRKVAQVDDSAKILQQNVSSDRELNGLIILFEESKHKCQAAEKVLAAARDLSPQLFVPEAVRVLTTYLSNKDIGVIVIDILRAVCTKNPVHFDIALEPAKLTYNERNYSEELACFFGDCIKTRASMAGVTELISKFISQNSLSMERIGFHRPSQGAIYALRAIAQVDREALTNLLKRCLEVGENSGRLAVCNIIEHLIDVTPEIGNEIFDPLLHSLRLEEDRYGSSADGKTLSAIAEILRTNISQYLPSQVPLGVVPNVRR